ncbi:glycerophosphoryl diester phosphodiesterase [Dyadobacter jejuensis]|uniref:Glycerophosphoryl diester phosphodiesterase n=1 Tax=Dyadobacter jejuensis TaxID=1082580 RepID=A0A316AQI7_9BACT|nr:glycerophosphodiester phosphodiesterase family protein [Dyadobacter jejuensis]PWJ59549.1 glycerophosphoryl diester phosphodiesterase [Dyadobacter jejuensis]
MFRASLCAFFLLVQVGPGFAQDYVSKIRQEFLNTHSTSVLVASHRAVHNHVPENSIPAIKEGIRLGIDILEIDVKVSKDGIPMLMHDGVIDRTTNGKGDLEEQLFEDLRKLRLVDKGELTDEKIPTLEEVLTLAKGHIMIDLDLKTDRMEEVIDVIRKTGTSDIVFFFDSDYEVLQLVDQVDERFMIMPRAYNQAMADSAIHLFDPEVVHIDPKFYTPSVTKLIKKNNARVWINALGKSDEKIRAGKIEEVIDELTIHGANIIQTDEPEVLLKALKAKGLHW